MSLTPAEKKLCELWKCRRWREIATKTRNAAVNFIEKCIEEGRNKGECCLHRLNNYVGIPEDEPFKNYGGYGAAIATFFSYASASYIVFFLSPKTRPIARIMSKSLLLPVRIIRLGTRVWI